MGWREERRRRGEVADSSHGDRGYILLVADMATAATEAGAARRLAGGRGP